MLPKTEPQKAKVHSRPSPFAAPVLAFKTEPKKGPFSSRRSLPTLAARALVAPIPPLWRACGPPSLPQTPCKARRKLPLLAQTPCERAATTGAPSQNPGEKYAASWSASMADEPALQGTCRLRQKKTQVAAGALRPLSGPRCGQFGCTGALADGARAPTASQPSPGGWRTGSLTAGPPPRRPQSPPRGVSVSP